MKAQKTQHERVYELLEKKFREYNNPAFIPHDPVSIPHRFSKKQDIEIIGFWTAMLAWGNRRAIMSSATKLIDLMDNAPHQFMLHHTDNDLKKFLDFKHRTFNATDALYFIEFFKTFYTKHGSLEEAFTKNKQVESMEAALTHFHETFFSLEDAPHRTRKHVATPLRGSTCKRMNMFMEINKVVQILFIFIVRFFYNPCNYLIIFINRVYIFNSFSRPN